MSQGNFSSGDNVKLTINTEMFYHNYETGLNSLISAIYSEFFYFKNF